jgi:hypothetical protein
MREYSTHFSQHRAQCIGLIHSFGLAIPLPRMDTWAHLCTYVITLCRPYMRSQNLLLVCFLAIVPLEKMFDWGGEQLAMYCGPDLGDLITITLNKYVRLISRSPDHADSSFPAPSKLPLQSSFFFDASMCSILIIASACNRL